MTPADMADVLSAAGIYDGRKISQADVAAWHAAVGQYSREDALEAVVRHYADSTDWMKPAHLKSHILAIRNERAASREHEVRALPSRFEIDQVRDGRLAAGIRALIGRWGLRKTDTDDSPHGRALARARRERGSRPLPAAQTVRKRMPALELKEPTEPPAVREQKAIQALHTAGRSCGRGACQHCHSAA
jgi:hypothetical protein